MRAAGRGMRVFIGQFMKGSDYGELRCGEFTGGLVEIEQFGSPACIPWREEPADEDMELARRGLVRCREVIAAGAHDIVILDEVNVAVHFRLIGEADLIALVDARPPGLELICTGRGAPAALVERADLVSEIRSLKHPYDTEGLLARDGIER
jgi:cob(I)alamin adenosyltransferase